ncbi:hypothetical protein RND81_11G231100 [Saponaria officinalis]
MCYTCPYSLCKSCVKEAEIYSIRGNKGFCRTCMSTIMLIEKIPQENKEVVHVDFDDTANWEYLFKMYWIFLKERETLTLDELIRASNPYKDPRLENKHTFQQKTQESCLSNASELSSSSAQWEANGSKRRNTGRQQHSLHMDSQKIDKTESNKVPGLLGQPDWASKELLEFVAHMKNGDTSVVPHFDVQALLLDYIRKNNLRDPRRKCQIICDKRLENLFGKDRVGHFEMLKLLEYHFKEESRTNGEIRGASMNLLPGQVEEGLTVEIQIPSRETRLKNRRKGDDKGRQINPDGYAAIDGHNINLIYLKRCLLETLTVDAENFHDKVVGSVVRIKISSSDQKQDMHRLVRIIGTSQATSPYKVGGKIENLMLKILNLNKIEDISIDAISDQEFSEDECRRLRQSIKLGLVERLTVGEIQKKALALQAVRVDHWLETEIRRLNLLRDRANEMGHRKEHREYVEKIELLKTPDERQRRIHEVPEVHADPRMDPSYGSDDDSGESDMKRRDGVSIPKYPKSHPKDERARSSVAAAENRVRKRIPATKNHVGGADGALGSSQSSQKTEKADGALRVPKIDSRTDTSVVSSDHGVTTNGSNSQAASDQSIPNSRGMVLVSDISELEKIWHYRDPAGKVQGPFCMLQLRKWDSSGFFPSDLRVWKNTETYDRSILLTDALRNQQTSEPQSHTGAKFDDENANSTGTMSSNSVAPWIGEQANEECSKSNSMDRASNLDANEQSVNGFSCQPESDGQCVGDQLSVQNLKAQLIESLFNIEEPSVDTTVNQSPDMMHVDRKSDPLHLSCAMTMSDNVDANSQAVKSVTSSPDDGRPDSGTSLPTASKEIEASELPSSMPSSNHEIKDLNLDDELHDKSDVCQDLCASRGTESGAIDVFDVPIPKNKDNCRDADKRHSAGYGHEQDSGESSKVSGGIDISVFPSAVKKEGNEGSRSYIAENRHPISTNVLGVDSGINRNTVSSGTDVSLLPSTMPNNENGKANTGEIKYYVGSDIPEQNSGARWSPISGGFMVSSLPSTSPKTEPDGSKAPAIENNVPSTSNIPGQDSEIRFSDISGGIGSSGVATLSLKLEHDTSKGVALENNHCLPTRVHGQDSCLSWLEDDVHLPDVAGEWGMYSAVDVKSSVVEFNSGLVSCSSAKMDDSCQLPHYSTNHQTCDFSDWQPIELSTLGDESVSDLLSEVEAMESLRAMSSPSSRMNCGDDSLVSPDDVCFSPLGGLSPNIDPGKNDALSSSIDLEFHMLSSHRDQLHGSLSFDIDVCDIPRTSSFLSALGLEPQPQPQPQPQQQPQPQPEAKPVITSEPHHNFVSQAPLLSLLPPPSPPRPSVPILNFFYQDPASLLSPPHSPPPPPLPPPQAEPSIPPLSATNLPSPPSAATDLLSPPSAASKLPSLPAVATKVPSSVSGTTKLPSPQSAATKLPSPLSATAKSPSPPSLPPPEPKKPPSPPPSETKKPPPPSPSEPKKLPTPPPPKPKKTPSAPKKLPVAAKPPSTALRPPETATKPPSSPSVAEKLSSPQPRRPSTLRVDTSIPREEGEVEPVVAPVRPQEASSQNPRSPQTATTAYLRKQGSKPTNNGWEQPGQPNGKFSGTGSILGSPNMHWSNSGQVMPVVGGNAPWSPPVINPGTRMSQTSPRYTHNVGRHPGPKDRNHHHHGADSGFGKNRPPTSWNNRPPPFGGGVPSRPPHKGMRVCKFYGSGNCKNGASCKYLHP